MADFDASLKQQVLDIAKRKRKPDIEHYRQADDLWAGLEVANWAAFYHLEKLAGHPARLKLVCSDNSQEKLQNAS